MGFRFLGIHVRVAICFTCLFISGCAASDQSPSEGDSISAAFDVMRGDSERFPEHLAKDIARVLSRSGSARPFNTQLLETGAHRAWAFLYAKKLCLVRADQGSVGCASKSLARSRGVVLGTFTPPTKRVRRMHGFLIIALLPDDVRYVSATVGRKSQSRHIRVPVRRNVVAISAERPILLRGLVRGDRRDGPASP